MFGHRHISNEALTIADIPEVGDCWDVALSRFALSYDGYRCIWTSTHPDGSLPNSNERLKPADLKRFAQPAHEHWSTTGALPSATLDELRTFLFWEQRAHHWQNLFKEPDLPFIRALCAKIRSRLRT